MTDLKYDEDDRLAKVIVSKNVNPSLFRIRKMLESKYVDLSELYEARKPTPSVLKRCVTAVAKKNGGDTNAAFAICTKSLQDKGYLEPGTQVPTEKGIQAGREKAADKEHKGKMADYEKILSKARKKKVDESGDLDVFGMDAMTQKRLNVKNLLKSPRSKKPMKPMRNNLPMAVFGESYYENEDPLSVMLSKLPLGIISGIIVRDNHIYNTSMGTLFSFEVLEGDMMNLTDARKGESFVGLSPEEAAVLVIDAVELGDYEKGCLCQY